MICQGSSKHSKWDCSLGLCSHFHTACCPRLHALLSRSRKLRDLIS